MKQRIYKFTILVMAVILMAVLLSDLFFDPPSNLVSDDPADYGGDDINTGFYVNDDFTGLYQLSDPLTAASEGEAAQAAVSCGLCESIDSLAVDQIITTPEGETYYQFQQIYQDIPVYGHRAAILTNHAGRVQAASGNCVLLEDVSTAPVLSPEDFFQTAKSYLSGLHGSENIEVTFETDDPLVIYIDPSDSPRLAYASDLSDGYGVYHMIMDASTGEILHFSDTALYYGPVSVDNDIYKNGLTLQQDTSDGTYIFRDDERSLSMYDAEGYLTVLGLEWDDDESFIEKHGETSFMDQALHYTGKTYSAGLLTEPMRISDLSVSDTAYWNIYASASLAFDYFYDVLGRSGYNGQDGHVKLIYNTSGKIEADPSGSGTDHVLTDNAAMYAAKNTAVIFYLGDQGNAIYAYDKNTTVHEYSHGVVQTIAMLEGDSVSETNALQEFYSDIFAELSESWYTKGDPDWENAVRQLYPGGQYEDLIYDYNDYVPDSTDGHNACTIASYAMYQIWQEWRNEGMSPEEAMEKMSSLVYRSIFLLPENACFSDFGYSLTASASMMWENGGLTSDQMEQVTYALQNVGILGDQASCLIQVTDAKTGKPIENASVSLHIHWNTVLESYLNEWISRFPSVKAETSFPGALNETTNASGQCCFQTFGGSKDYTITVYAEGYENYHGSATAFDSTSYLLNEIELIPAGENIDQEITETTAPDNDAQLESILDDLVAQYGVMDTVSEEYPDTGYGGGETLVPYDRLTGLLCADIYDYDSDGQNELLTVRSEPTELYDTGAIDGSWIDTRIYLSVYDTLSDGSAGLADERSVSILGLPDSLYSSSIQFMRGTQDGQAALYLDNYFNFNSQGFSLIRLTYDGALNISGGVDCSEFAYAAYCDIGASEGALETMGGRHHGLGNNRQGWEESQSFNWEGVSNNIPENYFEGYKQQWEKGLSDIGLTDSFFRTMHDPDPVSRGTYNAYQQYIADCCTRRPTQTCQMAGGGTLTELCGILSPYQGSGKGISFTSYDSTGLLDDYRDTSSDSASGNVGLSEGPSPTDSDLSVLSGTETTDDLFTAFSDAFLAQDSAAIADLYITGSEDERSQIEALWSERLAEVDFGGYTGIQSVRFPGAETLSVDDLSAHYSEYGIMPDEACILPITAYPDWSQIWPDWLADGMELYAIKYGGNWYLIQ